LFELSKALITNSFVALKFPNVKMVPLSGETPLKVKVIEASPDWLTNNPSTGFPNGKVESGGVTEIGNTD
jgi:hypothetical protein